MMCEGDPSIGISLIDTDNLWSAFHQQTTEMIVTKPGRQVLEFAIRCRRLFISHTLSSIGPAKEKIFPKLTLNISGLCPHANYGVKIILKRADKYKYRFANGKWATGNEEEEEEGAAPPVIYHINGFTQSGAEWMRRPVHFHHFKLTNNPEEQEKHMVYVQSLHKYTPLVEIWQFLPHLPPALCQRPIRWQSLDVASFIAVTAYQNDAIKRLKVNHNPFAAGLREKSRSPNTSSSSESDTSSRKRPSSSPLASPAPPFFPPPIPMLPYPIASPPFPSDPLLQYPQMTPTFYPQMFPYPYQFPDDFQYNFPLINQ